MLLSQMLLLLLLLQLQLASGSLGFHCALWPLCRLLISAGLDFQKALCSFFNKRPRSNNSSCVAASVDAEVAFTEPAAAALDTATITATAAAVATTATIAAVVCYCRWLLVVLIVMAKKPPAMATATTMIPVADQSKPNWDIPCEKIRKVKII